jgi:hypothetical protein
MRAIGNIYTFGNEDVFSRTRSCIKKDAVIWVGRIMQSSQDGVKNAGSVFDVPPSPPVILKTTGGAIWPLPRDGRDGMLDSRTGRPFGFPRKRKTASDSVPQTFET